MDSAKSIGESIMVIMTSIVLVAILAVLVSGSSQTAQVLQSFGSVFTSILSVIVSPQGGQNTNGSSAGSSAGSILNMPTIQ